LSNGVYCEPASAGRVDVTLRGSVEMAGGRRDAASPSGRSEQTNTPATTGPRIKQWLEGIPAVYIALNAAIGVVVPLFAPERFLPEPLGYLRQIPPIVVVIGFLMTWTTRQSLRKNLPKITVMMCLGLVFWVVLLVLFVRGPINGTGDYVMVGYSHEHWVDKAYPAWVDEAIIRDNGWAWGDLQEVFGRSFVIVALSYTLSYVLLLLGVVASLGGSTLVAARKPRS
jgi:hypothetical protein